MKSEHLEAVGSQMDSISALLLVGSDGLPIQEYSADGSVDLEALGAEIVALATSFRESHQELSAGDVRGCTLRTESHTLLLVSVASDVFLLAVADTECPIGQLRFELRRAALGVATALDL